MIYKKFAQDFHDDRGTTQFVFFYIIFPLQKLRVQWGKMVHHETKI